MRDIIGIWAPRTTLLAALDRVSIGEHVVIYAETEDRSVTYAIEPAPEGATALTAEEIRQQLAHRDAAVMTLGFRLSSKEGRIGKRTGFLSGQPDTRPVGTLWAPVTQGAEGPVPYRAWHETREAAEEELDAIAWQAVSAGNYMLPEVRAVIGETLTETEPSNLEDLADA